MLAAGSACKHHDSTHPPAPNAPDARNLQQRDPRSASAFGAYVTFRSPWTPLFTTGHWRVWLAILCGVSIAAAVVIYAISEFTHRREMPHPTPTPAG